MKKKGQESYQPQMTEEEFIRKEKERIKKNKKKNMPMVITTYFTVAVIVSMIGYIILFIQKDAEAVIANSRNIRQDDFANVVERGDIITSDGVVIASSATDKNGNTTRVYPYDNMFAHLVGYDKYGRAGLELSGNFYMLRSHVNIFERVYKQLKEEKNRGDNLVTTVDFNLQEAAYNALSNCNGAVVAIEPSTGKVKVMLSKPDYNPNNIDELWEYLDTEEGSKSTVLLNRATSGMYAPGSTFKVISLLEYIRENPNTYDSYTYHCTGSDIFDAVDIHCYDSTAHGDETLKDTLAYSCNSSFANLGTTFDYKKYRETADSLLFNCELPYQGAYSESYFEIDKDSNASELPQTVIGQGETRITPLHNAMIFSAIANKGKLMKPYLIDKISNDDGGTVKKFVPEEYGQLITEKEADILTEYMKSVCEYGTAAWYFDGASYETAGKTGTAEYDNEGGCNSWFVGFSNPDNPELVVSVIVEDYNLNGISATYVARQIFDAYYSK